MLAKHKRSTVITVIMIVVGLFGIVPVASAAPGDYATVTVVHGLPGVTVDVVVDGEVVLDNFEPGEVSGPLALTGENHSVEVTTADGMTATLIGPDDFDLTGGGNFTIVAHLDGDGTAVLTAFQNSYDPVDSGMADVIVRHVADADTVDVLNAADDSEIATDLSNGDEVGAQVPVGSYDLEVVAAGTTEPALIEGTVDLAEYTKYYVYAIGSADDDTLTLVVQPWDGFTPDTTFRALLFGENEVPPVESAGAGLATFRVVDEGEPVIEYSLFVFGLTDIVGGHIHVGAAGVNGGVAVNLLDGVTTPVTKDGLLIEGTVTPDDVMGVPDSGFDGSFAELVRLMRVDPSVLYVNVHTDAYPSGEIRGQVETLGVPIEQAFTDTTDSVHVDNIELIGAAGITLGCNPPDNDEYCPEDSITRGQMAAFLRRAFNLPASTTDAFTDDGTSEFEGDINAIAAFGITLGCNPPDNDEYCADDAITRGQMAAFLNRAFGFPESTTDQFTDDDTSVFEGDINAIFEAGITEGCNPPDNDLYCPDDEVTRGEMATFLARAFGWGD